MFLFDQCINIQLQWVIITCTTSIARMGVKKADYWNTQLPWREPRWKGTQSTCAAHCGCWSLCQAEGTASARWGVSGGRCRAWGRRAGMEKLMLVSSASFPVWTCLLLVVTEVIPTVTYMDGRKMMNFDSFQKKNIWGTYGPWQETTRESHKVY